MADLSGSPQETERKNDNAEKKKQLKNLQTCIFGVAKSTARRNTCLN